MKIDEKALDEAGIAVLKAVIDDMGSHEIAEMTIRAYLAALPKSEPEPMRDRIAVVVDRAGVSLGEAFSVNPNWVALEEMAADLGAVAPFARSIIACNLRRPADPAEITGRVEP